MTKPRKPTGVALLARINLVIYILLTFWALSNVIFAGNLFAVSLVLYSIAGVICSSGLLQQKKWSLYMAVAMWTAEGVISLWVIYSNIGLLSTDPETIAIFLSIAIFKFATAAYLTKKKVREGFVAHNALTLPQATSEQKSIFPDEDTVEKGNAHQ